METDVPKGWTGERGGLSRDHKRIRAKKWENGEGESETKSSGPSLLRGWSWEEMGKSGRAGRRRRRKGREGGEPGRGGARDTGLRARGAGRGGDEGGLWGCGAAGGGARAPQSSSALLRARGRVLPAGGAKRGSAA